MLNQLSEEENVQVFPFCFSGGILSLEAPFEGLEDGIVVDAEGCDGGVG